MEVKRSSASRAPTHNEYNELPASSKPHTIQTRHPTRKESEEVNIGSAVLGTRWYNFQPLHRTWAPQCTALQTDGHTDRQTTV